MNHVNFYSIISMFFIHIHILMGTRIQFKAFNLNVKKNTV
jgi:hypothetical protein